MDSAASRAPAASVLPGSGSLAISPMDEASARALVQWRYEPPYDVYNLNSDDPEGLVQFLVQPENCYQALRDEEHNLVAFCCFGPDAQVPGGDYQLSACDVGLGVRPDLTGQGLGRALIRQVLVFAECHHASSTFRVTVAAFNQRALSVWQKLGFGIVDAFRRDPDGTRFVVLMRSARTVSPPKGEATGQSAVIEDGVSACNAAHGAGEDLLPAMGEGK